MRHIPDASSPPHAGVAYPPPLLYVVGLAVGVGLHRWRPWPITAGASTARMTLAILCLLAWAAIFLGALTTFRRARTTMIPNRPATALVSDGPYRFTRNPMYVSLVALYLAVTLFVDSWWPLVLLPVVMLAVDRMVIAREERYLGAAYPTEYSAYRARVRRWL
jgi:protein-S-isoprenylcysteine O-methyltransferase Ste14